MAIQSSSLDAVAHCNAIYNLLQYIQVVQESAGEVKLRCRWDDEHWEGARWASCWQG